MRFLAIVQVLSIVSCGAFLVTTAVPFSDAKDQSGSSRDLITSKVQKKTAKSSGTSLALQQPVQAGSQGISKEAHPPPDSQREPTASEFLTMAKLVYWTLCDSDYQDPVSGIQGIPLAFGGDIAHAYTTRSNTGPFKTITISVLGNDRLKAAASAKAALKNGQKHDRGATLKVTGQEPELKAELERAGLPTVSAPIKFFEAGKDARRAWMALRDHLDIGQLPIYMEK